MGILRSMVIRRGWQEYGGQRWTRSVVHPPSSYSLRLAGVTECTRHPIGASCDPRSQRGCIDKALVFRVARREKPKRQPKDHNISNNRGRVHRVQYCCELNLLSDDSVAIQIIDDRVWQIIPIYCMGKTNFGIPVIDRYVRSLQFCSVRGNTSPLP